MSGPQRHTDPDACAAALLERLGGRVRLALPLGLGKPVRLVNALYRQVREQPDTSLTLFTALTLEAPRARSALEARLLDGMVERLYGNVPELEYAADRRRGSLPDNVRVVEFYLRPGAFLGNAAVQRDYVSSNYTHVARDLAAAGVNAIAQMVAPGDPPGQAYSLSCNPDLTLDLIDERRRSGGDPPLLVGEANPRLPYFGGDAALPADDFALLLEGESTSYELFAVPNRPVGLAEHAIGIRVATLVRDGGTLQIGIGSLGDAVAHAIGLRRTDNAAFRELAQALGCDGAAAELDGLPSGLYASSEMFVEGFLRLREQGVLCRTVDDGAYLHGGFFLGSAGFYERLRALPADQRAGIHMTRISFTNALLGDEAGKRRQRRDARFVNTAMMATLLGAVVSDGLEDGRVVSGVGGQYNFVAMAHELEGGRSIIVLPSTRESGGRVTSNIVLSYGHVTIPRHLRDLVVTEYGIADLRGASDQDVVAAMLSVADSRFQEGLRRQAVAAGKLPADYRIPERFRGNTPEALTSRLTARDLGRLLPWYPLGSDFTREEGELAIALGELGAKQGDALKLARLVLEGWHLDDPRARPALARLGLDPPQGLRDRVYRALVAAALQRFVHAHQRPLGITVDAG